MPASVPPLGEAAAGVHVQEAGGVEATVGDRPAGSFSAPASPLVRDVARVSGGFTTRGAVPTFGSAST